MSPRRKPEQKPGESVKHGPGSPDTIRHAGEQAHHAMAGPAVHPPHHPQKKEKLPPRHHPHTGPENKALDLDHGIHEDRPRPGKIAKKENPSLSKKPPR